MVPLFTLLAWSAFTLPASSLKLWKTPGSIATTVPARCRAALSSELECGPRLVRPAELETLGSLTETLLTHYCNSTCATSMKAWVENVDKNCGSKHHDWGFNISRSGNDIAKPLYWAHQASCITDKEGGEFCIPKIANRTVERCSDCTLKYLASFVGNDYAPEVIEDVGFSKLLTSCSADATRYPHSTATETIPDPVSTTEPVRECRGTTHTVKPGDDCDSIANAFGIAIDRFQTENGIDTKCQSMKQGDQVCIGLSCDLRQVQSNETCKDFIREYNFSLTEFLSWNPIIHSSCNNFASLRGRTICVGPPGEGSYKGPPRVTWATSKTVPPGVWEPASTIGRDAPNRTDTDSFRIPTVTITGNPAAMTNYDKYVKWCPFDDGAYEKAFAVEELDEECREILEPYCEPEAVGEPLPSPTFPSKCLPSTASTSTSYQVVAGKSSQTTGRTSSPTNY
ncbi:uncharacterized protein NECHADRAFT_84350 [Fusarium vanettenii 77-13-4]|uniref:LysM domain-containing protein n=1 Tax=Fusarium vanettenii (strain ATCC MYA-4622 / CBS 123669 / FGSC 9596 / NRRL 45880 / 77-13-4) TaxID=660122 RepID=C7ZCV3_FUSV7|nr:uncharacterized protein NECHADRAFT_84350 [Fusarium vanettenii 77-13-4]EEU38110.1 hypothetical protein NECHADRAFT_84350 [Fusarium vanettenii 77-13-4]